MKGKGGNNLKAAVLYKYGKVKDKPLKIEDVKIAEPKKGEVLLRVKTVGVCHSDIHVIKGKTPVPLPVVLGHEFVGEVMAVGEGVTSVNVGDMVVSSFIWPCGKCVNCATGFENLCETASPIRIKGVMLDGTTRLSLIDGKPIYSFLGGGYAEHAVVPEFAVSKLPPELRKESSAILGCAVLTAYGAVMNTAKVRPGEKVAIFGAGGVGMNVIQLCKIAGATQIIVVDIIDRKLSAAKEFGATNTVNASEKDPVKEIKELTEGKGADITFEVIGLADTVYQATESVRVGGKVVLIGLMAVGTTAPIHVARVVRSGIQILGNYGGRPRVDFQVIFELVRSGLLELDKLITKRWNLEQINEALEALEKGEVIRSIVVP